MMRETGICCRRMLNSQSACRDNQRSTPRCQLALLQMATAITEAIRSCRPEQRCSCHERAVKEREVLGQSECGIDGFFVEPAMKHHRNYTTCFVPATNDFRKSNAVDFFPATSSEELEERMHEEIKFFVSTHRHRIH